MRVIFSVGLSKNETVNELVREEADVYRDILQEDYIDSFYLLTLKVIGAFKWAAINCRNSHFVLKIDDNVLPNAKRLTTLLVRKIEGSNHSLGNTIFGKPKRRSLVFRNTTSEYSVSRQDYEPAMCMTGSFYMLTADLAFNCYNLSRYVNIIC